MAIKTIHNTADKTWFITFTCYSWLSLFEITNSYDLVYKWLNLIKEKYKIDTTAFAIMPNHVHLILHLNIEANLNTIISNGKRFMAYEIIARLKSQNKNAILLKLGQTCTEKEKSKGQIHRVFEPSFDAKAILSTPFLLQKLDYIHHNSVSGNWNLAESFIDYQHSSVCFYEKNIDHESIAIKHYLDLEN